MLAFRQRLATGLIIGDGGLGALLAERGLPAGTPPERWVLEKPEILDEIARAYVAAGAELITTCTFGGSPMRLAQHRLGDRFEEINRRAVAIVRAVCEGRAFVSASMGPTGHLPAPLGDANPVDVERGFAEQARVFIDAGADLICIETMTDLQEAMLAVRGVRSISAALPVIATMTFELTKRGPFTVMGVTVPQAAERLAAAGADVVGANCGAGVEEMLVVAEAFLGCSKVPVAIQPNAGLPQLKDGRLTYPTSPEFFADAIAPLAARGVRILGGCCGTTPAHIRALCASVSR
jgi:5-methyltetrahydrofolate--homocysteine methyltransferase